MKFRPCFVPFVGYRGWAVKRGPLQLLIIHSSKDDSWAISVKDIEANKYYIRPHEGIPVNSYAEAEKALKDWYKNFIN